MQFAFTVALTHFQNSGVKTNPASVSSTAAFGWVVWPTGNGVINLVVSHEEPATDLELGVRPGELCLAASLV